MRPCWTWLDTTDVTHKRKTSCLAYIAIVLPGSMTLLLNIWNPTGTYEIKRACRRPGDERPEFAGMYRLGFQVSFFVILIWCHCHISCNISKKYCLQIVPNMCYVSSTNSVDIGGFPDVQQCQNIYRVMETVVWRWVTRLSNGTTKETTLGRFTNIFGFEPAFTGQILHYLTISLGPEW